MGYLLMQISSFLSLLLLLLFIYFLFILLKKDLIIIFDEREFIFHKHLPWENCDYYLLVKKCNKNFSLFLLLSTRNQNCGGYKVDHMFFFLNSNCTIEKIYTEKPEPTQKEVCPECYEKTKMYRKKRKQQARLKIFKEE